MINFLKKLTLCLSILSVVTACQSQKNDPTPASVQVTTISGKTISLDGQWISDCVAINQTYLKETFAFSAASLNIGIKMFQGSCGQNPQNTENVTISFKVVGTIKVMLEGKEVLANKIEGIAISDRDKKSEQFKQVFYIDDSQTPLRLYHGIFGDDGGKLNADGFPLQLHNIAIFKQ